MRANVEKSGITVNGVAGTHTALLGMDATPAAAKGLLGFAIHRADRSIGEEHWLRNSLHFKEAPDVAGSSSTRDQPLQSFRWLDSTLEPQHRYAYRVVPVYGRPGDLEYGDEIRIGLTAESQVHSTHSIFFNRSVSASQAFVHKFGSVTQKELLMAGHPALPWLSRGLLEGMFSFLGKAQGEGYALRCCLYEFQFLPVLLALRAATERGVDVRIVCDDKGASEPNRKAIKQAGIGKLVTYRKGKGVNISHNKFMVLLKDDKPLAVWTGSTNVTSGGIFGQSNVGHVVRNAHVARHYHDYWQQINENPSRADFSAWTEANTPVRHPADCEDKDDTHVIFSPRPSLEALEYYADQMDRSRHGVFLTSAFGVSNELAEIFGKRKAYLRFILMDNMGQKALRKNTETIQGNPFNRVALGDIIHDDVLGQWHAFLRVQTIRTGTSDSGKPVRRSIVTQLADLDTPGAQKPFFGQVEGEKPRVNRFNRTGETEPEKIDSSLRVQAEARARRDKKPVDEAQLRDRQTKG